MTEQRLLKGEEVADILQVSRSFAYQLLRQGDIPVVRLGRAVRVRAEDLQRFIESNVRGSNRMQFMGGTN
jgi:excisionase family DNA binding protein